jgi:hypothetical protein
VPFAFVAFLEPSEVFPASVLFGALTPQTPPFKHGIPTKSHKNGALVVLLRACVVSALVTVAKITDVVADFTVREVDVKDSAVFVGVGMEDATVADTLAVTDVPFVAAKVDVTAVDGAAVVIEDVITTVDVSGSEVKVVGNVGMASSVVLEVAETFVSISVVSVC